MSSLLDTLQTLQEVPADRAQHSTIDSCSSQGLNSKSSLNTEINMVRDDFNSCLRIQTLEKEVQDGQNCMLMVIQVGGIQLLLTCLLISVSRLQIFCRDIVQTLYDTMHMLKRTLTKTGKI